MAPAAELFRAVLIINSLQASCDCGKVIFANNSCRFRVMQFYFLQNSSHSDMGSWELLCSGCVGSRCISLYVLSRVYFFTFYSHFLVC